MTAVPMAGGDPMAQSGARWCDEHNRWECAARPRKPEGHHAPAIRGLAYCKNCSGRPLAAAKAIGAANLLAWSTATAEGAPPVDPGRAVMDQLRLAVYRADLAGELVRLQMVEDPIGGIVGKTHAAGREGTAVESGEQIRPLIKFEMEMRKMVVAFAKTAHDMGIAERHIELEQSRAELVISAFLETLRVLQLVPADRDVAVRTFLDGLGRGEAGVVVAGELEAGGQS